MEDEADIINAFLDMCAQSLDPDSMDGVRTAVARLCKNRHIHESQIHSWGLPDEDAQSI